MNLKVHVIVMLTKLVENKRRKANQYWPAGNGYDVTKGISFIDDEEEMGTFLELGGGYHVNTKSTSSNGSYHLRQGNTFYKGKSITPSGSLRSGTLMETNVKLFSFRPRNGLIPKLQWIQGTSKIQKH